MVYFFVLAPHRGREPERRVRAVRVEVGVDGGEEGAAGVGGREEDRGCVVGGGRGGGGVEDYVVLGLGLELRLGLGFEVGWWGAEGEERGGGLFGSEPFGCASGGGFVAAGGEGLEG